MKKIIVDKKFDNKKLSSFFMSTFSGVPISVFYKLLRKKDIRVNGRRVHDDVFVHVNDEIVFFIQDKLLETNFPIIFEDDNILIVNKPVGVEVTNANASLTESLRKNYQYLEPCHRLDRNTSGLVVFAKNKETLSILLSLFKNHKIEKRYACIVVGHMPKDQDTLNSFLFKDAKKSFVYVSDNFKKGYLSIITKYTVTKYNKEKNLSLLDIELETGRTHQIRAHLAHIGHPILGDGKYGINEINKKFKLKTQTLCAYCLKFEVPKDNFLYYLNDKEFKIDLPIWANLV